MPQAVRSPPVSRPGNAAYCVVVVVKGPSASSLISRRTARKMPPVTAAPISGPLQSMPWACLMVAGPAGGSGDVVFLSGTDGDGCKAGAAQAAPWTNTRQDRITAIDFGDIIGTFLERRDSTVRNPARPVTPPKGGFGPEWWGPGVRLKIFCGGGRASGG